MLRRLQPLNADRPWPVLRGPRGPAPDFTENGVATAISRRLCQRLQHRSCVATLLRVLESSSEHLPALGSRSPLTPAGLQQSPPSLPDAAHGLLPSLHAERLPNNSRHICLTCASGSACLTPTRRPSAGTEKTTWPGHKAPKAMENRMGANLALTQNLRSRLGTAVGFLRSHAR